MKSKIITLAVAFVLGVTAIAFSVRPSAAPSGKGKGKNASVSEPTELAEIISALPAAHEYYAMAQQAALDKTAKSVAEEVPEKSGMRSVTVCDDYSRETSSYSSYRGTGYYESVNANVKQYQEMVASFTAEAVYYNVKYTIISSEERLEERGEGRDKNSARTETNVSTTVDAEYYLGERGAFFKFNNYEVYEESLNYVNNKQVDEEDARDEVQKLAKDKATEAIRKNYGKWINAIYVSDYDLDTEPDDMENMSEDDVLKAMAQMVCAEISVQFLESLMGVTETNTSTLKTMAGLMELAEDKSNDYYDKAGRLYNMTALGKYTMLSRFGYEPSTNDFGGSGPNDEKGYESLTPVKDSSFILDLSDGKKPAWYLDFDFHSYVSYNGGSSSNSAKMHEDIYFTNIDNTVVPKVKSKKTMYDFIGKQVVKIIKKLMQEGN